MNIKDQRAALLKDARDMVDSAKADGRELTDDEQKSLDEKLVEVKSLDERIERAQKSAETMRQFDAMAQVNPDANPLKDAGPEAKSIGEHFVKHVGARLAQIKGVQGASVAAPEFKAATDNQVTNGGAFTNVLTQYDRTIIQGFRPRPVIADLLGSGTLTGNAISYFVEGAREGNFTTVAEAGAKPQIHYVDPVQVTDALKKIAGFIKLTDEMIEDLDFVVSEINQRLLYDLTMFEESQLLSGPGTGSTVLGLLNRSGIQTELRGTVASGDTIADTLFRAITKVETATGLTADGLVISPADYQTLRLSRDANGQYYGGGFFTGTYGNGGIMEKPPIWGLRTVVTPAVATGTALVANFAQAATVYRKGGVRVESTNSHASDFTSNLVTIRAEERLALAVRRPLAFVKVTTTAAP